MFYELTPAYGRDYRTAKEVVQAFNEGKDFIGDYNLNFQYCSKWDLQPGSTVRLRYKANRMIATVYV